MKLRNFLKIKYHQLFLLQRRKLEGVRLRAALRNKMKTFPQFLLAKRDRDYMTQSKQFLKQNFPGYKNTDWHFYYSTLNGNKSVGYIPNDLYFNNIEPTLNNFSIRNAYTDKISFDLLFDKSDLPKTIFKMMNGKFYDVENELVSQNQAIKKISSFDGRLVLKPALNSGGGVGVIFGDGEEISKLLYNDKKYLNGSYIIQEFVKQHSQLAKYHPNSLNTCRLMTARVGSEIVILSAYLRIGRNNSNLDNAQSGGIMCKLDKFGNLSDNAMDVQTNQFNKHPDTGVSFKGGNVPSYKEIVSFCTSRHKKLLRFTFISWDIGVREDGSPVFIEYNLSKQSINAHQIFVGPLFGKYTKQLIKRYHEERRNNDNQW